MIFEVTSFIQKEIDLAKSFWSKEDIVPNHPMEGKFYRIERVLELDSSSPLWSVGQAVYVAFVLNRAKSHRIVVFDSNGAIGFLDREDLSNQEVSEDE